MANTIGEPLDFFAKHDFIVEIDGIRRAGFETCSELDVESTVIELHEGGRATPHKRPGKQKFANITLERGVTIETDIYDWFQQTAKMATGRGLKVADLKRTFDIVVLDRDGSERRRYTVNGAFPVKFVAGSFDGKSETDAQIESVELAIDYWEISK